VLSLMMPEVMGADRRVAIGSGVDDEKSALPSSKLLNEMV
jgi:hypothetical protein